MSTTPSTANSNKAVLRQIMFNLPFIRAWKGAPRRVMRSSRATGAKRDRGHRRPPAHTSTDSLPVAYRTARPIGGQRGREGQQNRTLMRSMQTCDEPGGGEAKGIFRNHVRLHAGQPRERPERSGMLLHCRETGIDRLKRK